MRSTLALAVAVATLALACTTATQPPRDPTVASPSCPLGVQGAQVSVDDTTDGVALTFVNAERTGELRARVQEAAAMHGSGARKGPGHGGKHGEGGHHGLQPMQLPPVRASVADVDGGARLSLVPSEPGELDTLRAKVRARSAAMTGPCH